MNQPSHGQFDPTTKTFYNSKTGKWVQRLRPSKKGKLVGNALGHTKGDAYLKKYTELGMPQKHLQIPVKTDIELVERVAKQRGLNYEHCLFILHKLLYNRARLRRSLRSNPDYHNDFTPLGSTDICKWIGKKYTLHVKLLIDIGYLVPKLSSRGNLSYWNGTGSPNGHKQTACYKIDHKLFDKDLFEFRPTFRTVPLLDIKLKVKLHQRHVRSYAKDDTITILQKALKNVRVQRSPEYLNKNFLPEIAEEVLLLINDINNGDIYVKGELDSFGERFHSSFTFLWSSLRPLIHFANSNSGLLYLDLSNSQYFFFTLLIYEQTYKNLIPEYSTLIEIVNQCLSDESFKGFCFHAQNATLYSYIQVKYGLKKTDLMKLFFAKSIYYKRKRSKSFPWLQSLIESIEIKFGHNILAEVLQKLESRNVLLRVCVPFLKKYDGANLISIHDGILFEDSFYVEIVEQLSSSFSELNLPIPKFKLVRYENPKVLDKVVTGM